MQAVFVNTHDKPIMVKRLPSFRYTKCYISERETILFDQLVEKHYRHPDAPEHATVFVLEWEEITPEAPNTLKLLCDAMMEVK